MGCFDSTCAITRLPIHDGDDIVYVEHKTKYVGDLVDSKISSTYYFMSDVWKARELPKWEQEEASEQIRNLAEHTYIGDIDEDEITKHIDEVIQEKTAKARSKVIVVHGKYNDYGGIGNRYDGEDVYPSEEIRMDHATYFFVHKAVWDSYAEDGDDIYKTLYRLVQSAFIARIELFEKYKLNGQQYSDQDFVKEFYKIDAISKRILPTLWVYQCYQEDQIDEQIESQDY